MINSYFFYSSRDWEVQDQGMGRFGICLGPAFWFIECTFSLCVLMTERRSRLSEDAFKATNSTHEGPILIGSSDPNYFPKSPPPTPWREGTGFQHRSFRRTQTFSIQSVPVFLVLLSFSIGLKCFNIPNTHIYKLVNVIKFSISRFSGKKWEYLWNLGPWDPMRDYWMYSHCAWYYCLVAVGIYKHNPCWLLSGTDWTWMVLTFPYALAHEVSSAFDSHTSWWASLGFLAIHWWSSLICKWVSHMWHN
jgi:hypothetical protein